MSSFAIIPWTNEYLNDRIFQPTDSAYINGILLPYIDFKAEFEKCGHIIHTIDYFNSYNEVDYFLFFTLDWAIFMDIVSNGMAYKMVYCTAEPPSVFKYNSAEGYRVLRHIFPYILTWNDDWVDNKSVFKRNMPYHFYDHREGNWPFDQKKLITSISGNKNSSYSGELYSERVKAIKFFENKCPYEFEFYGIGWDKSEHPCYGGAVNDKNDIYHRYRFAICYENIEGLRGYISEKILDCLVSGIVPIYAGSTDVAKYIPETCFIRLRDFSSYDELYAYLKSMKEAEYNKYLNNAEAFLNSSMVDYFSGKKYASYIMEAVSGSKKFKTSYLAYKYFKWKYRNL